MKQLLPKLLNRSYSLVFFTLVIISGNAVFGSGYEPNSFSISSTGLTGGSACQGSSVTLTATVGAYKCASGGGTYNSTGTITWYNGGGTPVSSQAFSTNGTTATTYNYSPSTASTGTTCYYYIVTWAANGQSGCSASAVPPTPSTSAQVCVTVVAAPTISLSSGAGTNNQSICQNTGSPSPNITFAISNATGASVTGLPAGMSGSFSAGTFTISGTPTAGPGSYPYTVSTTGNNAPCSAATAAGTITVLAGPTITLTSAAGTNNQTRCVSTAITNITYAAGGSATSSSVTWVPAGTPTGLSVTTGATTTISGTPTVPGTYNYTVTTTGGGCGSTTATGSITVVAAPSASTNGGDQVLAACATSTALTGNTPAVGTGTWTYTTSPAGGPAPTYSPSANAPNATVSGLGIGYTYTFTWTISNSPCTATSSSMTVTTLQGPGCNIYCSPGLTDGSTASININNVSFGTVSNSAANSPTAYQNYTSEVSCFPVGTSTVSFNISGDTYISGCCFVTMNVCVLIDWNSDGDFADANEVSSATITGTDQNATISVTVPPGALTNTNLRVRIILSNAACSSNGCPAGIGQTQDFSMILSSPAIANAGTDQSLNCVNSATLNASASTPSPSGFWSLVSGSGTITAPTNPNSTVTGLAAGDNVFQWTQFGQCNTSTAQVTITANGLPNQAVYAGLDISSCNASINLNASNPAPGTGQWSATGPSVLTFSPSDIVSNPTITGMVNGTYTLTWQVTVPGCAAYTDALTLNYGSLPVAEAGPNQTICPTGATLAGIPYSGLTGTWSSTGGPNTAGFVNVNSPTTQSYGMIPGVYTLQWCLSGGGCPGSSCDNVTITVNNCVNTVLHGTTNNQTLSGCSYNYYDNGGPGGGAAQNSPGNYANNIGQTWTTFCPDDPDAFTTLTFNTSQFYPGDYLVVYDDPGPGAPIVGAFFYDPSPGGGPVQNPTLGTTITSSTGCLYVQMNTTATNNYPGFSATVGCSSTAGTQNQDFVTVNNCGGGGGITLCQGGSIPAIADVETNPPDLGNLNSGCLGSQENASNTWVYIVAESDGYIAFEISPAGGQDFDYAIWGPYDGGYACPGATLDSPIRCTWADNGGSGCPADIGLGVINSTGGAVSTSDFSEGGFCSTTNEGWTYPINATAGEVYVLLFQNFGYNNSSFDVTINTDPTLIPDGASYASLGCDPPVPLPIELITFVGEKVDRVNKLYWNCATENANDYFTVEKSSDGKNWSTLAVVDGAGYSQELTHYSTTDEYPLMGVNYYRLVQTDFDGTRRSYKTIAINNDIEIVSDYTDLYPNPTSNSFYFNYGGSNFHSEIAVNVYNAAGQLMSTSTFMEFNTSQSMEVETSSLPDGFYQVELIQDGKREVKKLTVIH